ncbi:site-specific recombinase, phage integrase family [Campylobacter iguaniorum]|uniref:site-specific integrase n=1 Tax=Campylobacter iguaniorum TaxID=1244531 RepID=UPI00073A15F6|nr:site-specific integrase [Campylobacter iguaniorum]ALV24949.1 site-specific recombinase, phage integrase family [Campylobacter iguaniorum]
MRPIGSTKDRQPILSYEFQTLLALLSYDRSVSKKAKNKLFRAFYLLYATGCRVSEIAKFHSDDIATIKEFGKISLNNDTKTKKPRALLFNAKTLRFLNEPCFIYQGYLFSSPAKNKPMSVSGLTTLINTALEKYLGECYTTHSFRAGYINRICDVSNVEVARSLVGHRSIKTTIRYLCATTQQKTEALEKAF